MTSLAIGLDMKIDCLYHYTNITYTTQEAPCKRNH